MTEIETLRAQVAKLKAENARFAQQAIDHINSAHILHKKISQLKAKNEHLYFALTDTKALELGTAERLAIAQANNQRLQEAVKDYKWNKDENNFIISVQDILLTPLDTSALEAIVQKAGEAMRERCANVAHNYCMTIRALPGVTLKDLK